MSLFDLINVENIFIFITGFIIGYIFPIIKKFKQFVEEKDDKDKEI